MNRIELHEIIKSNVRLVFSRSGGNGGQNVNKVNTKVHAFLPVGVLPLSEQECCQLRKNLKHSINVADELYTAVQEERTQNRNLDIALVRLEAMIVRACRQKKVRRKTKPTAASRERRMQTKKQHAVMKQQRKHIDEGGY